MSASQQKDQAQERQDICSRRVIQEEKGVSLFFIDAFGPFPTMTMFVAVRYRTQKIFHLAEQIMACDHGLFSGREHPGSGIGERDLHAGRWASSEGGRHLVRQSWL